jgi:hypothetical protein
MILKQGISDVFLKQAVIKFYAFFIYAHFLKNTTRA